MTTKGLSRTIHAPDHYENFPVASIIIPKKLRGHVISVYNFARLADDVADEGTAKTSERLRLLELFDSVLKSQCNFSSNELNNSKIERQIISITKLAKASLSDLNVSSSLLSDLLKAFKYDSDFTPFENWQEIFEYCKNSANPVGRILLGLFGVLDNKNNNQKQIDLLHTKSDAVCTGLQIINFAQDANEDCKKGRATFPRNIWPKKIKNLKQYQFSTLTHKEKEILIKKLIEKGHQKILEGQDLPTMLMKCGTKHSFRFALEISLIIQCGLQICKQISNNPNIVWTNPPKLKLLDMPKLFLRSLYNVILKK